MKNLSKTNAKLKKMVWTGLCFHVGQHAVRWTTTLRKWLPLARIFLTSPKDHACTKGRRINFSQKLQPRQGILRRVVISLYQKSRLNTGEWVFATASIPMMPMKLNLEIWLRGEQQEKEVYEEDPCYNKDQGGDNVLNSQQGKKGATEYKEKKTKRSGRHSCFYQAER